MISWAESALQLLASEISDSCFLCILYLVPESSFPHSSPITTPVLEFQMCRTLKDSSCMGTLTRQQPFPLYPSCRFKSQEPSSNQTLAHSLTSRPALDILRYQLAQQNHSPDMSRFWPYVSPKPGPRAFLEENHPPGHPCHNIAMVCNMSWVLISAQQPFTWPH